MADHNEIHAACTVGSARSDGSILISMSGELDIMTAQEMRQAFLNPDVISASQVKVDLTQTTFFDSSAVGIMVAACKRVRHNGGDFSVSCHPGSVRLVLEISGLVEYLQVQSVR